RPRPSPSKHGVSGLLDTLGHETKALSEQTWGVGTLQELTDVLPRQHVYPAREPPSAYDRFTSPHQCARQGRERFACTHARGASFSPARMSGSTVPRQRTCPSREFPGSVVPRVS